MSVAGAWLEFWSWGEVGGCGICKGDGTLSSRAGKGERNKKLKIMVSCLSGHLGGLASKVAVGSEYTPSAIKQVYDEILKLPRRLACCDAVFLVRQLGLSQSFASAS